MRTPWHQTPEARALLPEREQYAAWKAEELAKFRAEHPGAPDWQARDAADAVASLMLSRAKRAGLFEQVATVRKPRKAA